MAVDPVAAAFCAGWSASLSRCFPAFHFPRGVSRRACILIIAILAI
jgi:hypothetical protein